MNPLSFILAGNVVVSKEVQLLILIVLMLMGLFRLINDVLLINQIQNAKSRIHTQHSWILSGISFVHLVLLIAILVLIILYYLNNLA